MSYTGRSCRTQLVWTTRGKNNIKVVGNCKNCKTIFKSWTAASKITRNAQVNTGIAGKLKFDDGHHKISSQSEI